MSLLSLVVAKIYLKKITIVEKCFLNFEKFAHVKKTALTYLVMKAMNIQNVRKKFIIGGPE